MSPKIARLDLTKTPTTLQIVCFALEAVQLAMLQTNVSLVKRTLLLLRATTLVTACQTVRKACTSSICTQMIKVSAEKQIWLGDLRSSRQPKLVLIAWSALNSVRTASTTRSRDSHSAIKADKDSSLILTKLDAIHWQHASPGSTRWGISPLIKF